MIRFDNNCAPRGLPALFAGICLGALALNAVAEPPPGLALSDQWLRVILPSRPAAGYFTLTNSSDQAYVLDGAASPSCDDLMLHLSISEGGVERMTMVDSVDVPAHGSVQFAPGGYHLMCTGPGDDVVPGHSVVVTLHFRAGGEITAEFPVRSPKDE